MVHETELDAKVAAVNAANQKALDLYPIMRGLFEPHVGEKLTKVDGTLMAKFAKIVPDFVFSPSLNIYKMSYDYSLAWVVTTCESFRTKRHDCEIASYHETPLYVGELRNGVLIKMCEAPQIRTDYSAEEVRRLREVYQHAKQLSDDAFSALHPFGEW